MAVLQVRQSIINCIIVQVWRWTEMPRPMVEPAMGFSEQLLVHTSKCFLTVSVLTA